MAADVGSPAVELGDGVALAVGEDDDVAVGECRGFGLSFV
jgi:hypothetical protein